MGFGKAQTRGFSSPSEIFANILNLLGPSAAIKGPNFIINNKGFFLYNGTPAVGNLIASFAPTSTTVDSFGNTVSPIVGIYASGGYVMQINAQGISIFNNTAPVNALIAALFAIGNSGISSLALQSPGGSALASPNTTVIFLAGKSVDGTNLERIVMGGFTAGGSNMSAADIIFVGSICWALAGSTGGNTSAAVRATVNGVGTGVLFQAPGPGAQITNGVVELGGTNGYLGLQNQSPLPAGVTGASVVASQNGQPCMVNSSGLAQNGSGCQYADFTQTVVTATGNNVCGKSWSIPANDALVAGATYEFDLQIIGKQGTTVEALTIGWQLNGTSVGTITFPTGLAGVSVGFAGLVKLTITIASVGSGGSYWFALDGHVGAVPPNIMGGNQTATNAINTTVANTVQFEAGWGSATGAPTMTTVVSRMRRIA